MFRVPRIWSNRELRKIAPLCTGIIVNVSGWDDRDKEGGRYREYFINAHDYYITNYVGFRGTQGLPEEIPLDLEADLPNVLFHRFDVVFNHTTLEHVFDIRKAFGNLCALSKDAVIVVVPFAQIQHESDSYGDYWRFTPLCLEKMFQQNGLTTVYESASPHANAGVYLFAFATRNPDVWRERLPAPCGASNAGSWIGRNRVAYELCRIVKNVNMRLGRTTL